MNNPNQFRLQASPAAVGANYLSIPTQWGGVIPTTTASPTSYIPSAPIAQPPPPSLPPAQVASATLTANQPVASHAPNPSPRRTLTDADRRRMCLFHEENPNVKQTEIGAMFGVERSTVSKVLRQKEKYLYPDDGSRSPVKRTKGKFPDIERALSVWAKNANKKGVGLTDKMIWDRARLFATSIGISESHFKANSQGWLEKFKQKNNLVAKADGEIGSPGGMNGRARSVSSVDLMASPMALSRSQDSHYTATQHGSPDSFLDWGNNYKHAGSGSVSSASLSSMFTESGVVASPTSPFFSADGHPIDPGRPSPVFPAQQARLPPQMRPRSQTFPLISVDSTYISPPSSSEPLTPKLAPQPEMPEIDPALSNPVMSGTEAVHPALASPPAPSKEDAKRALELVMTYLRQQPVDILLEPDEYLSMTKLLSRFGLDGPEGEHTAMLGLSS
ncbi:hypothetical protein EV426DRAFT_539783 [Tirmania nivea]|nr:hypothetical protein EV426DRAFT_539783 [Tirmania nivea]